MFSLSQHSDPHGSKAVCIDIRTWQHYPNVAHSSGIKVTRLKVSKLFNIIWTLVRASEDSLCMSGLKSLNGVP